MASAKEIPDRACDNVCSICETGGPDDDGLLLCDGFCLRAFHPECIDLKQRDEDGYWACFDCTHGLQRCFVCKQYERSRRMVKCTYGGGECGKWFHIACAPGRTAPAAGDGSEQASAAAGREPEAYICPQHTCHACGSTDIKSKCLKCTKAYCQSCRPAAVHLLDDRKYFTCVEHIQGAALPPERPAPEVAVWPGAGPDVGRAPAADQCMPGD